MRRLPRPVRSAGLRLREVRRHRQVPDDGGGKVIDTNSEITSTEKLDGTVKDAVELAQKLAGADEVRTCVARQWMRFGLGRDENNDDTPSLTAAMKGFGANDFKVTDLLVALAKSDTFRYQKVKP